MTLSIESLPHQSHVDLSLILFDTRNSHVTCFLLNKKSQGNGQLCYMAVKVNVLTAEIWKHKVV